MAGYWWGPPLDGEQRSLVELVDALAEQHLARAGDLDSERITGARRVLAEHGLWTVGVGEEHGGGGADGPTTALVLMRIAAAWPAIGLAAAHAHAAAAVLAGHLGGQAMLADMSASGHAVAVVDLAAEAVTVEGEPGQRQVLVARVDATTPSPDLVVLVDATTAAIIPAERATFGGVIARTGLDGATTVPVQFALDTAGEVVDGADVAQARRRLRTGITAVAAGIAQAALAATTSYTAERVQFGAPLTALPTMRDSLFGQASAALTTVLAALTSAEQPVQVAALLDTALTAAIDVTADGVQAHGGYGYLTEYPAEALFRDAVSLRAAADAVGLRRAAATDLVAR
jgi:alkylation response protein AidB-like acyl-CoA dehydrogenase